MTKILYIFSYIFLLLWAVKTLYLIWFSLFQEYDVNGCSDGKYGGQRYFTCKGARALFVPVMKCSPDSRFFSSTGKETSKSTEMPPG